MTEQQYDPKGTFPTAGQEVFNYMQQMEDPTPPIERLMRVLDSVPQVERMPLLRKAEKELAHRRAKAVKEAKDRLREAELALQEIEGPKCEASC